ncbi:hypothetical protein SAMN04488548_10133 [Gordonia westfalica]|uniref:Uncharacterized protein n=1 Tax=Gordonia westfalica TaxID=158898 RepID=A0A1H2DLE0_9ACTN|nr:hypothetical protein SAMN04488548_10133 [Gordonia westfalica]
MNDRNLQPLQYTLKEAAQILGVSEKTLRREYVEGRILFRTLREGAASTLSTTKSVCGGGTRCRSRLRVRGRRREGRDLGSRVCVSCVGVWAILPPLGPEELVAFVIVAVLLLMTVVGFCMPTQEVDQ